MRVPFGRYRGLPIEEILTDKAYVNFIITSDVVYQLYPAFVTALRSQLRSSCDAVPNRVARQMGREDSRSPALESIPNETPSADRKRLPLPSRHRLRTAYHWLVGINMRDRRNRLLTPPPGCQVLVDWLSPKKRQEYQTHGGLEWRDWYAVYLELARRLASPG